MKTRIIAWNLALALLAPAAAIGQTEGVDAVADRPGIGTLVSSLDGLDREVQDFQSLGRLTRADIRVVGIGSALNPDEIATFHDALARNRTAIDELQKFVTTSDVVVIGDDTVPIALRDYLGEAGIAVSDIVAVNVTGNTVTFFVGESPIEIEAEGVSG
ncbi:hypothetical protein BH20GEM1_BH20GEM1_12090 [soil metagenome]